MASRSCSGERTTASTHSPRIFPGPTPVSSRNTVAIPSSRATPTVSCAAAESVSSVTSSTASNGRERCSSIFSRARTGTSSRARSASRTASVITSGTTSIRPTPSTTRGRPPPCARRSRRSTRGLDETVGALIEAAGGNCTTLVVASHGMGPLVGGYLLLLEVLVRLGMGSDAGTAPASAVRRLQYGAQEPSADGMGALRATRRADRPAAALSRARRMPGLSAGVAPHARRGAPEQPRGSDPPEPQRS